MVTGAIEGHCGSLAELGRADVSIGRPVLMHYVVVRQGDEGLEVLRMPLEAKGEMLPVFSVGWAARGYLSAEAPGGGWHARSCAPEEMFSLLDGAGTDVEWVALDPRPGRRGGDEVPNMMPWESFVDYLSCSGVPSSLVRNGCETIGDEPHGRENDQ